MGHEFWVFKVFRQFYIISVFLILFPGAMVAPGMTYYKTAGMDIPDRLLPSRSCFRLSSVSYIFMWARLCQTNSFLVQLFLPTFVLLAFLQVFDPFRGHLPAWYETRKYIACYRNSKWQDRAVSLSVIEHYKWPAREASLSWVDSLCLNRFIISLRIIYIT